MATMIRSNCLFFYPFYAMASEKMDYSPKKNRMNQSSFRMNKIAAKKNDFHSFSEHLLYFVHSEMFANLLENGDRWLEVEEEREREKA